jgi:phage protein D
VPNPEYSANITVKIDGSDVSKDFMSDVQRIVVDATLHMPSMFTIKLRDPELEWVDYDLLDLGKPVEISAQTGAARGNLSGSLFKGEITALEPRFSGQGETSMVIRGYDKSHRLHRGKKTATWLDKKDSELATAIAGNADLGNDVDATSVTYDYIMQYNQSDMEFLLGRAERIGYQVLVDDGKLLFKKGTWAQSGATPELTLGENLLSFQPCWSGTHQAETMIARSWDPMGKAKIEDALTPNSSLNQGGMTTTGGAMASSAFGSAEEIITTVPAFTVDEATAIATGLQNDISREFVSAEGVCEGDPRIKAGGKVDIVGVGDRFSGTYFVTSVLHTYSAGGYETRFSISGRKPNTLSHLLDAGNGHGQAQGLVNGVVPAMVTDLQDPDELGRIKVKYPWLDESQESFWVRVAAPMAGPERGMLYLPEIDDEVLIAFEHGDIHRPYMVGALWSSTDAPPEPNSEAFDGGKIVHRMIKTRAGHVILLDDSEGEELVSVTTKDGHTIILDDGNEQIIIRDKTEKNEMVINSSDNSMTISVEGDFSVTAKGKISMSSTGDMSLESSANAKIKAKSNFEAEGMSKATVKGTGGLTLESTANAELKGSMISVNGSAMTEVKGALVKIN